MELINTVGGKKKANHVTVKFKVEGKYTKRLEQEIKRMIRRWKNINDDSSFKVLLINREQNSIEEFTCQGYRGKSIGSVKLYEDNEATMRRREGKRE